MNLRDRLWRVTDHMDEGMRWPPFSWSGYAWTTDARICVGIRSPIDLGPPKDRHLRTLDFIMSNLEGQTVPAAAIARWAGDPEWVRTCADCCGAGKVPCCDGEGGDQVDGCTFGEEIDGAAHAAVPVDCGCDGGNVGYPDYQPGWIGPFLINRTLLARALDTVEPRAERATLYVPKRPAGKVEIDWTTGRTLQRPEEVAILVYTSEWRICVMGIVPTIDDAQEARAPHLRRRA